MRIAIVNTWRGGAVHNIMFPLAEQLREMGHEVDYLTVRQLELDPGFDKSFSTYDIVHFGYFSNIKYFIQDIEVPFTCGVHHIPMHVAQDYATTLRVWNPAKIVCSEPYPVRQLAQLGILNTIIIPYAFDHSRFHHMPYPQEFTVGYLGCDSESKRFHIIEQAAKEAKVPCVGLDRATNNEEVDYLDDEDILKFYESISCYVVAGFNEGGPLPPQEALLCGRPVITTKVGMMPQLIADGVNGMFYDGSVSELRKCLTEMRDEYETYKRHVSFVPLPTVEIIAEKYEKMFERVVSENS